MNRTARRTFEQAATTLIEAFGRAGPFPDQEATPPLLADEVRTCLDICQQIDAEEDPAPAEEIDELGRHALECLSDLGLWAWQLKADDVHVTMENIALDLARWIVRHDGRIAVLEPVVNALTRQANATSDQARLSELSGLARDLIDHAGGHPGESADPSVQQPWLALHFNGAIIAARAGDIGRMTAACDLLEAHLPGHCTAFYAEGLRESAKPAYDAPIRAFLQARFAKWTARH